MSQMKENNIFFCEAK